MPRQPEIEQTLANLAALPVSATARALKTMYHMMRAQWFWDGNKRTAIIAANYQMIAAGAGIINIAQAQLERWHALLSAFYESGDDGEIVRWTYEHCVHGIEMQP